VTCTGLDADCCGTGPRTLRMRSARWELDVENVLRSGVAEVRGYDAKVRILGMGG
jgi:hypothetical protein